MCAYIILFPDKETTRETAKEGENIYVPDLCIMISPLKNATAKNIAYALS